MSDHRPTFLTRVTTPLTGKPCARCYTPMRRIRQSWACDNPNCSRYGRVIRAKR